MNKLWLSLLLLGGSFLSFAQTGSIEVNTGGFSLFPPLHPENPISSLMRERILKND